MAVICKKCGGIIPDFMLGNNKFRSDCKNHMKQHYDIKLPYDTR